jgi:DNA repair exonuclease SbcCD ATPase subunit
VSITKIVKTISVKNFLGLIERTLEPGKVNIISGAKGSGKTSLIESIEYGLTGKLDGKEKRGSLPKTELIKHGEKEATLFIELNDGLTVDRKIRAASSDYFKVSKPGEAVSSTENYLRSFIKGDIFRPGEFLKKSPEEQASIILNMLEIAWTKEDIVKWFGEEPSGVNYDVHILKILKQIEKKYYDERAAVNQQIDVLAAQAKGYKDQLPANYDGEEWRNKKVQEYYNKVSEAQEINRKIDNAKAVIDGLTSRIETIKANAETDKQTRKNAYDRQRNDAREFIQFLKQKIEKSQTAIGGADERLNASCKTIDDQRSIDLAKTETDYKAELQTLKEKYAGIAQKIKDEAETAKAEAKKNIAAESDAAKDEIAKHKNSISAKEQELINVDELEKQALQAIDEKTAEQIKTVDAEAGNSKKTLEETQPVEIEPLQKVADEVATMQGYLRDFDLMKDILLNKLAPKKEQSAALTAKIEKARSLPLELLKVSKCPIDGITVDGDGKLRINGTLINGLSDGEMKDLSVRIAKSRAEAAELKIICFDGFQDLNPAEQKKIIEEAKKDGFQWFFLKTTDGDLNIEIIDTEG